MFEVDWKILVTRLLPSYLRKTFWVVWLTSLLKPLVTLFESFQQYRIDRMHEAGTNSQTIILESRLNDDFGGGIRIKNNSELPLTVFYPFVAFENNGVTPRPVLYPVGSSAVATQEKPPVIYRSDQYQQVIDGQDADFVVEVPLANLPAVNTLPSGFVNQNAAINKRIVPEIRSDDRNFDFIANMNAIINKHKLLNRNHAIRIVSKTDNTDRTLSTTDGQAFSIIKI